MREFTILGSSIVAPQSFSNHQNLHHTAKIHKQPLSNLSPSHIAAAASRSAPKSAVYRRKNGTRHDAELASKHAGDGRLEDFAAIAETAVASGVAARDFASALRVDLVAEGICVWLSEGNVWGVVEVLRRVERLGVSPLALMDEAAMELLRRECRRVGRSCGVEEAVELMEVLAELRFKTKNLVDPSEVIRICIDRRDPNMAIRYAYTFRHAEILYCNIIKEFGKKRDLPSALLAFEASQQKIIEPNMYIYRTIIDVCGICCDYLKSRYIYEELLSQKVTPNTFVFNSLMNVNAGDLSYTLQVYKNMKNLGVSADMTSYNILLKACCQAGRVDMALDIYRDLQQLESTEAVKLDVFTYSTIIKVFAEAKLCHMALAIKDDMLSAGVIPNTVTWSSLISAHANAGDVDQAMQLFDEMLLAGCEPDSTCYNILLHACVEVFQYDRAFRLFWSWTGGKISESCVEDYSNKTDDTKGAEKTPEDRVTSKSNSTSRSRLSLPKTFSFKPTTATYNLLMKACGTDYDRAKEMLDEMKQQGLSPNSISWTTLINICGLSGNVEGAIEILSSMEMAGFKPDVIACTAAIKVCVGSKDLNSAFSLYEEMKRSNIQPNLVTYNTLLRARRKYGSLHEVQQCLAVYLDMRRAGYRSSDSYLKELIEEWCEGVIQNSDKNREEVNFSNRTRTGSERRPHTQSVLLEKIAAHLKESATESFTIDLQGLTKVEARIVVLAVLRMIKENYTIGDPVKDDLQIILGAVKANADSSKNQVKDAVTRLLEKELGLEVLSEGPRVAVDDLETATRRPAAIQRLKVTRKSLYSWLLRRALRVDRRVLFELSTT